MMAARIICLLVFLLLAINIMSEVLAETLADKFSNTGLREEFGLSEEEDDSVYYWDYKRRVLYYQKARERDYRILRELMEESGKDSRTTLQ